MDAIQKPAAARDARTIGDLERLVGIGPDHASRLAFWIPFAKLGDRAFEAGRDELYRRINAASV